MKLLLHLGLAKTGSTSLQNSLSQARDSMLTHGVFYPPMEESWAPHHFLSGLYDAPDRVPFFVRGMAGGNGEKAVNWAARCWQDLQRGLKKLNPDLVVLSSEVMIYYEELPKSGNEALFRTLAKRLQEDFSEVRICAYVRNPADHFLSLAQQFVKSRSHFRKPEPLTLRKNVEDFSDAFGVPVEIAPFDRTLLLNGDIVTDFSSRFLSPILPEKAWPVQLRHNESMSPEAMAICQFMRRGALSDREGSYFPGYGKLSSLIREIEQDLGPARKPILHEGIREAILRGSTELFWLRDEYGIVFPEIDYDAIDGVWTGEFDHVSEVAEICDVDATRRDAILAKLVLKLMEQNMAGGGRKPARPGTLKFGAIGTRLGRKLTRLLGR